MIVADTNLLVYLVVASELTERARQIHGIEPDWIFPPIALSEATNALATLTREKWITPEIAVEALAHIEKRIAAGFRDVSMRAALELAIQKKVSAYDAQFIVLARSLEVHLVTEDGALQNKFPEVAISMEAFAKLNRNWTVREKRSTYDARRKRYP